MSGVSIDHFEALYGRDPDPWAYGSSDSEQAKYRRTLAALPDRIGRGLELGSSIGVFTSMLAPRCDSLVALDWSPTALAHARERNSHLKNVEHVRAVLPGGMPAGPFDAIVCSEILYYWDPVDVVHGADRIERALAPEGTLVAVHWREPDPRRPLTGGEAHAILRDCLGLEHIGSRPAPEYEFDVWRRQ